MITLSQIKDLANRLKAKFVKLAPTIAVSSAIGIFGSFMLWTSLIKDGGPSTTRYEAAQKKVVLLALPDGQGTGIVFKRHDAVGHERVFLWTAAHVMGDYTDAKVRLLIRNEGRKVGETDFTAKLVAIDKKIDIALLYVQGAPASYFVGNEFDSILPLHAGDPLYHVGNFFGEMLDGSFSKGVVSQIGAFPSLPEPGLWPVLDQSTFTIEPGSSGGPVFNDRNDKVVGIAVGKAGEVSFFVPVRAVDAFAVREHLEWAVYGDVCPTNVPLAPPTFKDVLQDIVRIFSVN